MGSSLRCLWTFFLLFFFLGRLKPIAGQSSLDFTPTTSNTRLLAIAIGANRVEVQFSSVPANTTSFINGLQIIFVDSQQDGMTFIQLPSSFISSDTGNDTLTFTLNRRLPTHGQLALMYRDGSSAVMLDFFWWGAAINSSNGLEADALNAGLWPFNRGFAALTDRYQMYQWLGSETVPPYGSSDADFTIVDVDRLLWQTRSTNRGFNCFGDLEGPFVGSTVAFDACESLDQTICEDPRSSNLTQIDPSVFATRSVVLTDFEITVLGRTVRAGISADGIIYFVEPSVSEILFANSPNCALEPITTSTTTTMTALAGYWASYANGTGSVSVDQNSVRLWVRFERVRRIGSDLEHTFSIFVYSNGDFLICLEDVQGGGVTGFQPDDLNLPLLVQCLSINLNFTAYYFSSTGDFAQGFVARDRGTNQDNALFPSLAFLCCFLCVGLGTCIYITVTAIVRKYDRNQTTPHSVDLYGFRQSIDPEIERNPYIPANYNPYQMKTKKNEIELNDLELDDQPPHIYAYTDRVPHPDTQ